MTREASTQVALARALGLSTSYVNQLENDQRPITVPVLLALSDRFDLPTHYFAPDADARLVSDLREILTDGATTAQIEELVARMPEVGQTMVSMHRRLHDATAELEAVHGRANLDAQTGAQQPMPFEEVRDFFYDRRNYIDALDRAAEDLFARHRLRIGGLDRQLAELLSAEYGISVIVDDGDVLGSGMKRRYRPEAGTLYVARWLLPGQRAFQLATQMALVMHSELISTIVATDDQLSSEAGMWRASGWPTTSPAPCCSPTGCSWPPPRSCGTTSISSPVASRWDSRRSAIACRPCSARMRAGFRSSSSAPTARGTSRNVSPPLLFTSPGWAATARCGWCTTHSPVLANS